MVMTADKLGHFKLSSMTATDEFIVEEITKNPRLKRHKDAVRDIAFAPGDVKFLTCSTDKTVKIWDTYSMVCDSTWEGHGSDVLCADWHPSLALVASGGKDRILKFWSPNQKNPNVCNVYHHTNSINAMR